MNKHSDCPGPDKCTVPKTWDMCDVRREQIKKQRIERADPLRKEDVPQKRKGEG